jgi:hypothetical protein
MIPDFPYNIKIRLAQLKKILLRPDFAKSGRNKKIRFHSAHPNVHIHNFLYYLYFSTKKLSERFNRVRSF